MQFNYIASFLLVFTMNAIFYRHIFFIFALFFKLRTERRMTEIRRAAGAPD